MFKHLLRSTTPLTSTTRRAFSSAARPSQFTQFSTTQQHFHHFRPTTQLRPNVITSQTIFRQTRVTRDWHQHLDHKTREYYYENIFTGEKTKIQPKVFLPHDAPKESGAMAFLRSDRAVVGAHKKKSVLRPVLTAFTVAAVIYTLGEMGYLDKLFGYVPPERRPALSENVDLRAKDMLIRYEDATRK